MELLFIVLLLTRRWVLLIRNLRYASYRLRTAYPSQIMWWRLPVKLDDWKWQCIDPCLWRPVALNFPSICFRQCNRCSNILYQIIAQCNNVLSYLIANIPNANIEKKIVAYQRSVNVLPEIELIDCYLFNWTFAIIKWLFSSSNFWWCDSCVVITFSHKCKIL